MAKLAEQMMQQILLANSWLNNAVGQDVLARALLAVEREGEPVQNVLLNMGELTPEQLTTFYQDVYSLVFFGPEEIDAALGGGLSIVETPVCFIENDWLVLGEDEQGWVVLARDPLQPQPHAYMAATLKEAKIYPVVANGLRHAKKILERSGAARPGSGNLGAEQIREIALRGPIVQLVAELIDTACASRASDIHFEPGINSFKVRQRIDGVLHDLESLDPGVELAVLSRIKILGGMDIAERRLPQDGRFSHFATHEEVDVRVSVLPLAEGESAVLRLLRKTGKHFDLAELGVSLGNQKILNGLIAKTSGVVLVTGPTGSGKTTTLYALLKLLNKPDVKIISLEDPVEYAVEGVNQVQVNSEIGFDFASGLRSILRQDPDVLMVGEIRDSETAKIALQAALTGHLVISTVHTNDALSAVTRLLDLGVPEYLLNAALIGVVGQRLVRTLCPQCRSLVNTPDTRVDLYRSHQLAPPARSHVPGGCEKCSNTGFIGRELIMESIALDDSLRAIPKDKNFLEAAARYLSTIGANDMVFDGLTKAINGKTTVEEVMRVAG